MQEGTGLGATIRVAIVVGTIMELPTKGEVAIDNVNGHFEEQVDNAAVVQLTGHGNGNRIQHFVRAHDLKVHATHVLDL